MCLSKIIDCCFDSIMGLSKKQMYVFLFCCIFTFLFGPIVLAIHYESSLDFPLWLLIICYVFTGFWGLIIGGLILLIIFLISFILLQFCCEEYCCEDSYSIDVEHPSNDIERR